MWGITLAGLPPMSPHKFRHGHATYGLKQARDVADVKAVSKEGKAELETLVRKVVDELIDRV